MTIEYSSYGTDTSAWPKADYRPVALMRYDYLQLEHLLGVQFILDNDDLGEMRVAMLCLSGCNVPVMLAQHLDYACTASIYFPHTPGTELATLEVIARNLGLERSDFITGTNHGYTVDDFRDGKHKKSLPAQE